MSNITDACGNRLKKTVDIIYIIITIALIVFSVYVLAFEKVNIYSQRDYPAGSPVTDYTCKEIRDDSFPQKIAKEYSWTVKASEEKESSLIFHATHSYVVVKLNNVVVYSIMPDNDNLFGNSPGSNWVSVPIYPTDNNKVVSVKIIPAYKLSVDLTPEFIIGSERYSYVQQLKDDMLQIVLAILCICLGLILMIVQICLAVLKKESAKGMFYLGNFSLLLGIWRIIDIRFTDWLFESSSMSLSFVSIAALFTVSVPMLLFLANCGPEHCGKSLTVASIFTSLVAFVAMILQVCDVADMRELLVLCHICLLIDVAVVATSTFKSARFGRSGRSMLIFAILLVAGCFADIVFFYLKGQSSGMSLTLFATLVYMLYYLTETFININIKAYVDPKTQLYNKARWEEYIKENVSPGESIGVMMLDLNSLKHINDVMGHVTGDRIISEFARILKNCVSTHDFVCRWGGDEFTVLVKEATIEKMEQLNESIHKAVGEFNKGQNLPDFFFASGYVLSREHADLSVQELLVLADKEMYKNKMDWYKSACV